MQENKKEYDRKDSTSKNIRFPDKLLGQIETDNFSRWVIEACRERLKNPFKSTT